VVPGLSEGEAEALIAIDTNILIYAFDVDATRHAAAKVLLAQLARGSRPWALPWPCVPEFLKTVTEPRSVRPAVVTAAFTFLELVSGSPSVRRLLPTDDTGRVLREVLEESGVRGRDVHDAHIFALCLEHGVRELLTADKGFRRFRGIKVTNPFA
jgi:toxin-antitoxin system PIN domain toxin